MQVTIYDLAYQGKVKEDQVTRLVDSNVQTALNIARLKSARSLGNWFSAKTSEVDFVNQKNIVEVKAPSSSAENIRLAAIPKATKNTMNLLTRLFTLRSIAEAQPIR
jgi:hypothetical protein